MRSTQASVRRTQSVDSWMAAVVLGSIWGFSEVVLSAAIRAAGLPYRAAILTGIGVGLMAIALAMFRSPLLMVILATVAILCKQLVVPILHVSLMCKANSCLAVLLQGAALAGVVAILGHKVHNDRAVRAGAGASTGLVAGLAFYILGMRFAPCPYLLSFSGPAGFLSFLALEAIPWALCSAVLLPLGYALGSKLNDTVWALRERQPLVYYLAGTVLVAASWLASAGVIAAGL